MIKSVNQKKAFTLIEVLVACAILIILITAVVDLGVTLINAAVLTRQRTVAYYLGQEGIETVRQIRDSNSVDGNDQTNWNSLVYSSGSFNPFDTSGNVIYGVINLNGRFALEQRGDSESITVDGVSYQRKITFIKSGIIPVPNTPGLDSQDKIEANAARVIITINWQFKGSQKSVEVRELITNWKQLL